MSLHDFPTGTMVAITNAWLDPERQRELIESCARLSPLLEDVAAVHADIVVYQNKGKQEAPEIAKLRGRTTALDARHDRLARVINYFLLGLIEASTGEEEADRFRKLRAELLPQGLDINLKSYLAEAGDADLREQRLSGESKGLLEKTIICVEGRETSLAELVSEWGRVARELGDVESVKIRLKAAEVAEGSSGPARRAWVRIVLLFLQTLELEKGLTDAQRREIVEPLRDAEAKAARKRAAAKKKNVPFDPDAEDEGNEDVES